MEKKGIKVFETASFHIVKPCNMRCKFCYATFDDMNVMRQLRYYDACDIIEKLDIAGVKKITFDGGEPLIYKHIEAVIRYSKEIGMTTSIITNGSLLSDDLLRRFQGELDWIGVSIDSLREETNKQIGRIGMKEVDYRVLLTKIKDMGFKLKINTVVNSFNFYSDFNNFIDEFKPERWKVFQALRVKGQNDKQFDEIRVYDEEFEYFVNQHKHQECIVVENNEAMTGSYLRIDPLGRLYENSSGKYTYSRPLQDSDVETCLGEINLNREMFIKRGGIYQW